MLFTLDAGAAVIYKHAMLTRPQLTINLSAIVANWRLLAERAPASEVGATVKANAYGLGVEHVAPALWDAGCKTFFVATFAEALELRAILADADIYVFQGPFDSEMAQYAQHHIRPVLNMPVQLAQWCSHYADQPAALHINSGMRRLGLTLSELRDPSILAQARACNLSLLITHYASASLRDAPLNVTQRDVMQQAAQLLPDVPTSYANSAAHFLDASFHGDITRPGCALYGINPCDDMSPPMQPVATLEVPILQRYTIEQDGTISYGNTQRVTRGMKTITIAMGYADGLPRYASHRLHGYLGKHRIPLLGRVTMDMTCFDVSHVPEAELTAANSITLMDTCQTVNDLAAIFGTIGYEVLTGLGNRVERCYVSFL